MKKISLVHVLLLEFLTIVVFANIFIIALFKPVQEVRQEPTIIVDNIDYEITSTSNITDGMIWQPYHAYMLEPTLDSERANDGNMYAPEILVEHGMHKMWYGAQGKDGKDRIHYATSSDGIHWQKYGVVIDPSDEVHANDPTVVKVNGSYYMYYTVATVDEWDKIYLATSSDGLNWTIHGLVLDRSSTGWDSYILGRPSVLYENDMFKMWYDGMEADPLDQNKHKEGTGRHVGYATSTDGINWNRWPGNPIVLHSGAVDVEHFDGKYVMVEESGGGVLWRTGQNETSFSTTNSFLFQKQNTTFDLYGHVTPFIFLRGGKWIATYTGAATRQTWDGNRISAWFPIYNVTIKDDSLSPLDVSQAMISLISQATLSCVYDRSMIGTNANILYTKGLAEIDAIQLIINENISAVYFDKVAENFTIF